MSRLLKAWPTTAALFLFVSACGGGGGGGSNTVTPPTQPAGDTNPPVITIQGESNIELAYGTLYEDEGASAEDDSDGTVTVNSEGSVDTFTTGTYTITYSASDAAGNSSTVTRTVEVLPKQFRLDISVFGDGVLTVDGQTPSGCTDPQDFCTEYFDEGSSVTLTIAPESGWSFEDWQACDTSSTETCTVEMDSDKLVLATLSRDAPLTLKSNVILLSEAQIDGIINYNPASSSILFSSSIDPSIFQIGSVIVSTGSPANETYFARRVVDVLTLTGSTSIVETVDATLEDVIEDGTLLARPDITGTTVLKSSLPEGITVAKAGLDNPEKVSLILSGFQFYSQGGVTVSGNGSIDLDFQPDLDLDFTPLDGLRSFRFSGETNVTGSVQLSVSGTVQNVLSVNRNIPLGTVKLGTFIYGPAVFVVEAEFSVPVEIGLSANVTPTVSITQIATLGVQWHKNSDWTNLSRYDIDADFALVETISADLKAQIGGRMKPSVKLYGVAGPFIESEIYGGGVVKISPTADCTFVRRDYVGTSILAGGEIELFSKYLAVRTPKLSLEKTLNTERGECETDMEPPTDVTGLTVQAVSSSELGLAWEPSTDNLDVVAYQIWRRDENFGRPRLVATTAGTSYLDPGLEPEVEYCYYVLALDEANNSSMIPTSLTCGTTLEAVDEEPPTTPQGLTAEAVSTSSIELDWGASTDNEEVVGYIVIDYTNGESSAYEVGSVSSLSTLVSKLNPETEYCFAIRAYDRRGNRSERSNIACATTPPSEAAEWTIFLGCQGLPFILEEKLDLDQTLNSNVQVTGQGLDYPGTPLSYVLIGIYNAETSDLSADITWAFENIPDIRVDRFTANLGTGDSGIVPMAQIQVTGCDAQIQIVRNDTTVTKPVLVSIDAAQSTGAGAFFER